MQGKRVRVNFDPSNIINERYGRLVVVKFYHDEYVPRSDGKMQVHHVVECKCDCGKTKLANYDALRRGNLLSCGCLHTDASTKTCLSRAKFNPNNVVGETYGRLTVIGFDHDESEFQYVKPNGKPKTVQRHYVKVQCECGNVFIASYKLLRSGKLLSCGCLRHEMLVSRNTTHGLLSDPLMATLYRNVYTQMIRRCYNESCAAYKNYGGRGISICDEWYTPGVKGNPGFVNFSNWAMSNGYKHEPDANSINIWSIDRIKVDGNYCPDNCRWATREEQANNKRNNITLIDITGEEIPRGEFSSKYGLDNKITIGRYNAGWSMEALLFDAMHQELGIRKISHHDRPAEYVDRDGFIVLIPTIDVQQSMYQRRVANGRNKTETASL